MNEIQTNLYTRISDVQEHLVGDNNLITHQNCVKHELSSKINVLAAMLYRGELYSIHAEGDGEGKLTQTQVGDYFGVSNSTVSDYVKMYKDKDILIAAGADSFRQAMKMLRPPKKESDTNSDSVGNEHIEGEIVPPDDSDIEQLEASADERVVQLELEIDGLIEQLEAKKSDSKIPIGAELEDSTYSGLVYRTTEAIDKVGGKLKLVEIIKKKHSKFSSRHIEVLLNIKEYADAIDEIVFDEGK